MRYIITIRTAGQPQTYYLSQNGCRCYTSRNVAVFSTEKAAREDLAYFAAQMPTFELGIERLPARLPIDKAVLAAVPV